MINDIQASLEVDGSVEWDVELEDSIAGNADVGTVIFKDGTNDYNKLKNKPKIEGNELVGDKSFAQLGLDVMTPQDIDDMLYGL